MFTTEEGARRYQEVLVPLMFASSARRLVADAKLPVGAHVLDVATGTGIVARTAAKAIGGAGRVTAVDATGSMLAVARSQPSAPGAAPIEYLQSTIEDARSQMANFTQRYANRHCSSSRIPRVSLAISVTRFGRKAASTSRCGGPSRNTR